MVVPFSSVSAREHPLAQFYYLDDPDAEQSLRRNSVQIELLSPAWFTVGTDGRLRTDMDQDVLDWAAEKKVPLAPLVANKDFRPDVVRKVLDDEGLQKALIAKLLDLSARYHLAGIQLDIEEVPQDERDRFTRFVQKLALAFRAQHLQLSMAAPPPLAPAWEPVAPGSSPWIPNDHAAGFDYARLAEALDFISLMTYDEYTRDPGPVAGLPWMEASVAKTLEWVPAGKLLLGLPLYYTMWAGKKVTNGSSQEAAKLAADHHATVAMDPVQMEKTFHYTDKGIVHTVWFSDADTVSAQIALVRKYKLRGYAAWRLGMEDPAAWQKVFSVLQEK
jgi:spore germination protein YaaH